MNTDKIYNQVLAITSDYIIKDMQKDYQIPVGETPDNLSKDICSIYKGAVFDWCAHEGDYPLEQYVERLLVRCIHGILGLNTNFTL